MERNGQINRSQSPWTSPVLLKKDDGSPRFVVDYRKLNSITIRDSYTLLRMDDAINKLAGAKYYSKFDLKCGYHQVPIDPQDKHKTAFITPYGLFEFNVLLQGLINGPSIFQRIVSEVLINLLGHHCLVYLDDIITFSTNFNGHVKGIHAVSNALNNHNFKLYISKCALVYERIEYLGHEIDHAGYRPLQNNIKAVIDIPTPITYDEAHRFYGVANYYRSFIKNFPNVAYRKLTSEPCVLKFPIPDIPFILTTDASSENGIGVTLKQKLGKREHVIVYLSQNLTKVERKWSVTEQECLAIVWAIKKLRIYLYDADCLSRAISSKHTKNDISDNEYNEDNIPLHNEFRTSTIENDIHISHNNAVQTRAQKAIVDNESNRQRNPIITSQLQHQFNHKIHHHNRDLDHMHISRQQLNDPLIQHRILEMHQHPSKYPLFAVEHNVLYKLIEIYPSRRKRKVLGVQ
ncbi:unnamed protein product [Rotaria magnacalcarata]|uniref:Reverse transcriptase domain-containing protein n=1 Tax=Rotaria magnacalcarata TaxID=392030 RepID=A0A816TVF0_9BILA|nr:unnamed protein product [Rotaria magnacalcarata]